MLKIRQLLSRSPPTPSLQNPPGFVSEELSGVKGACGGSTGSTDPLFSTSTLEGMGAV